MAFICVPVNKKENSVSLLDLEVSVIEKKLLP